MSNRAVPITLDFAVRQILEWVHGRTNIPYEVLEWKMKHGHPQATFQFMVATNRARVDSLVHPLGLILDEVSMLITGSVQDEPEGKMPAAEAKRIRKYVSTDEIFTIDPKYIGNFQLKLDNGGNTNVTVTTHMKFFDKGDKAVSAYFMFRNGLLHKIR